MERRGEHLRLARLDHAREQREQTAPLEVGHDLGERTALRGRSSNAGHQLEPLTPGAHPQGRVRRQDTNGTRGGIGTVPGGFDQCPFAPEPLPLAPWERADPGSTISLRASACFNRSAVFCRVC